MTIALIDGDVLAYQACKPRWMKKAKADKNGQYVAHLDENGKKIPLEWTREEDAEYLEESWNNFEKDLNILVEKLYCDDYLMAVKGEGNYRHFIYPSYKLQRTEGNELARFVPAIRRLAVMHGYAIQADGREADDYLRIWARECREADVDYILCTIDKDLKCIPGRYFNMKKETLEDIDEFAAKQFYYAQILSGDTTDNIPGIPGIGEKKAIKLLNGSKTDEEFQEAVVGAYISYYGDKWYDYLLLNAKLIHIQTELEDYFSFKDWPVVKELV
jgi:5'-3' exonuclease